MNREVRPHGTSFKGGLGSPNINHYSREWVFQAVNGDETRKAEMCMVQRQCGH